MTLPSPDLSDPTADLYQKAVDAYYAGRFDIASAHVDEILAHTPEHAHAMHLGGLSLLASGNAEAAQRWVARALEVAAEPNFYNTLYSIQFKLGAFNDAIESLRRGLTLDPDFAAFHYNLAWALQQLDVLDQAVISYRRALELDPDNASIHNNLGFALQELGAPDTAEFHYRRAIALVPDKPTSRHNLGRMLLAKGQYDEAWPYYEDRWVSQQDSNGRPCPVPIGVSLPRWRAGAARNRIRSTLRRSRIPVEKVCWSSTSKAWATACTSCATCRWRWSVFRGLAMSARHHCGACMSSLCARAGPALCCSTRCPRILATGTGIVR